MSVKAGFTVHCIADHKSEDIPADIFFNLRVRMWGLQFVLQETCMNWNIEIHSVYHVYIHVFQMAQSMVQLKFKETRNCWWSMETYWQTNFYKCKKLLSSIAIHWQAYSWLRSFTLHYSIIWENRTASGPSLKFGFHNSSVFRKPRF